jgi:predicted RNA-binding Zn-ribbon protein involved in translation (DUF1610 family)
MIKVKFNKLSYAKVEPTAFITVNKQRVRQDGKMVYLKDQTEFELELYNPTEEKIKAMIFMDGKPISFSGLVLKPGQRVFLERFLDDDRKFKYETYDVDDILESKNAISNNGRVCVKFFRELKPRPRSPFGIVYDQLNVYSGTSGGFNEINTVNYNGLPNPLYNITCSTDINNSNTFVTTNMLGAKIETGTVEKGSNSNQTFKESFDEFDAFHYCVSEWQIMPYLQKPKTAKDLVEKCAKCNTKLKSNHKFCPECGEKNLGKRDTTEEFLQSLTKEQLIELLKAK